MNKKDTYTIHWKNTFLDPNFDMNTLPFGIEMVKSAENEKGVLILLNLADYSRGHSYVEIFHGPEEATTYMIDGYSSSIIAFNSDNNEKNSAVIAIASGSNILVFKDMVPFFKFCMPQLTSNSEEVRIWQMAGQVENFNNLTIKTDLISLKKEIGSINFSSRTLKFLSHRECVKNWINPYQNIPVVKLYTVTVMGSIRRDSWCKSASCNLIVGTEQGEVLIIDHRAFVVVDKYFVNWTPATITSTGLWTGDGQIIIGSRDGILGKIRQRNPFTELCRLSSPIITMTFVNYGVAVVTMNNIFTTFSVQGIKLWSIMLPGYPLDMINITIKKKNLSYLAISIARHGVKIYDRKYKVDSILSSETISCLKFGQLGQQEHTMAMVLSNGGLNIQVLNIAEDFNTNLHQTDLYQPLLNKFIIPKKTSFFIEQSVRERLQANIINFSFQQAFLRLRFYTAINDKIKKGYKKILKLSQFSLQTSLIGLNPTNVIKINVTNITNSKSVKNLYIICKYQCLAFNPCLIELPFMFNRFFVPLTLSIFSQIMFFSKLKIFLCSSDCLRPLAVTNIVFPISENNIKI